MGEGLSYVPDEVKDIKPPNKTTQQTEENGDQQAGDRDRDRIKDIDTAHEIAEMENPMRGRMLELVKIGVPREEVEKNFEEQLDTEAKEAESVYKQARKIANQMIMDSNRKIGAVAYLHNYISEKLDPDEAVKISNKTEEIVNQMVGNNSQYEIHEINKDSSNLYYNPNEKTGFYIEYKGDATLSQV